MTDSTVETELVELRKMVGEFEDFINEPPQYEDLRMVRDYRHEAYRKWEPICRRVLILLAERATLQARIAEAEGVIEPFAALSKTFEGQVIVEICEPHHGNPSPHIAPFPMSCFRAAAKFPGPQGRCGMKLSTPLEIRLYDTLKRIAKGYQTPAQIRRECEREKHFGPDYEEYLEMAYENIQQLAANAIRGVRIGRP